MKERAGGRLSWVEEGDDAPAAPLTWVVGVVACALAAWGSVDEPARAAGAALVLVAGATTGRLLRLDQLFRSTGAWMWAIGVGTVAFVAGAWLTTTTLGLAIGLFILPLDWRLIPRLRASVGAGLVFAALAIVSAAPPRLPLLAAWAPLAALTLLLLERDVRNSGRQAADHRPPGLAPVRPEPSRIARDALSTAAVALTAVVLAVVLLPPASPAAAPGQPGRGGQEDPTYWGFSGDLDMATRSRRGDDVVLRVRADTPALWRGDSYERFDGRRWTQRSTGVESLGGRERLTVPEAVSPAVDDVLVEPVATDEQVQVFTFERGGNDLVFGANRPRTVLAPGPATWSPGSDAVRLDRPLGRGGAYTVISRRPRITEERLRTLDDAQTRALDDAARSAAGRSGRTADPFARYLAVPDSTSARTRTLAAEATAGAATTVDRIRALEAWLAANTRYRLDVPALPPDRDAVDQFLFEDREGFCEQIAAALAIMLRTLGVPTRLAVGFVPDHQDAASGEWIVLDRNAHAWVEVWWPGVGWQGFDPTAGVPLAPDEGASTPTDRLSAVLPAVLVAVVLVVGAVGAGTAYRRLRGRRRSRSWAERAVARLDGAGARAGRPRRPDETLVEYGAALDGVLAGAGAPALARSLSGEIFAGGSPGAGDGDSDGAGERAAAEGALAVLERAARQQAAGERRWRHPTRIWTHGWSSDRH